MSRLQVGRLAIPLLIAVALCAACSSANPVESLQATLIATGIPVSSLGAVPTDPFIADGHQLCVAGDKVRTYTFPDAARAQAAAASINPADPTMIGGGTAIVDWAGQPRFWLVGRMMVAYFGPTAEIEASLSQVLGPPFASGQGMGRAPDAADCQVAS